MMSDIGSKQPGDQAETRVSMPAEGGNPILVEVIRGPMVESRHRGAAVVVDVGGTVRARWGNADAIVYPRSSIKPLQAIALVETGAADAYGVSEAELALACASHNGEARHANTVVAWLDRLGLSTADLECGVHWPYNAEAAQALAAEGTAPGPEHNNCSGKHAGFLTIACHLGKPTRGYVRPEHPVQQYVMGTLETMCEVDLANAPCAIDGCSIPTWGMPLGNLALGMAKFGAADRVAADRAEACRKIATAMTHEPFMVAGTGRYCTDMLSAANGQVICKTGAEGVYCAALPGYGLGVALKCDDGATRASEVMLTAILQSIGVLDELDPGLLAHLGRPRLHNRNDIVVGEIRPSPAF